MFNPQPKPDRSTSESSSSLVPTNTPENEDTRRIQGLIDQVAGLTTLVKNGSSGESDRLIDIRIDITTLAKELERGRPIKETLQRDPILASSLREAANGLTSHLESEKNNGKTISSGLQNISAALTTLTQQLGGLQIDGLIEQLNKLTEAVAKPDKDSISEDLLRQVLQKLDALGRTPKLDESHYKQLAAAIEKFNTQYREQGWAERISTLNPRLATQLEMIQEELHALQNTPGARFAGLKTTEQKRVLLNMIEKLEKSGDYGALNLEEFVEALENQGFVKFKKVSTDKETKSAITKKSFTVVYDNSDHLAPGETPREFIVKNSAEDAYKAAARHKWAAAISWGSFVAGASAIALAGTPILLTIGLTGLSMTVAGMWNGLLWQQSSSKFEEAFGINLDQKTSVALSPQKMLLETLSTYTLIRNLPDDATILNWAVTTGGNNSAFTSLSTLLTAMKNTIKYWDEFRLNIPDLERGEKNPGDMAQLRDREFDQNIERFKPWLPRIRNSFLRYPRAFSTIVDVGTAVGALAGTLAALGGGLPWLGSLF